MHAHTILRISHLSACVVERAVALGVLCIEVALGGARRVQEHFDDVGAVGEGREMERNVLILVPQARVRPAARRVRRCQQSAERRGGRMTREETRFSLG